MADGVDDVVRIGRKTSRGVNGDTACRNVTICKE